jgi:hypothetical protein
VISDGLKAIAGARWTRDELSYNHARTSTQTTAFAGVQPATNNAGSTSESAWSGRTGLQYDLSKDISTYATVSRGYKGPAYNVFFNMLNRDTLALKPETSDSYEIGIKAIGFDKKLSVNLAAFQTNYKNYQANFYDTVAGAVVTRLINAGEVSTRGVEIDVEARPVSRLNLSTSLAYIDARIDQFNCPAAAAASCTLNGQTLPFSPKWKSFSRASYGIPLANGLHLELSADYSWQSKVQYDLFQSVNTIQGSVGLINASIALSSSDNGWRIALIGKNLGDKSYATNLVNSSGYVTRAVPATINAISASRPERISEIMTKRELKLGAFLLHNGHHVAAWRHPQADTGADPLRLYQHLAKTAERACFDAVFFADSVALTSGVGGLEPLTLLSAIAAVTDRIGLIGTATTTYNEPYHVARKFASLDRISRGRAGWNLVTSDNAAEAANFGRTEHVGHAERYERAKEFHQVVQGLWDSWEDDAILNDKQNAIQFDPQKLHTLQHHGKHFSVAGPLNVSRSPQESRLPCRRAARKPERIWPLKLPTWFSLRIPHSPLRKPFIRI